MAEFRQQRIAELKAIGEDTKGGGDGYRQGVGPVVELEMIIDVHGYHEGQRQSPEDEFGHDAAGIIKIAGDVEQPADGTDEHADGKGRKGCMDRYFDQVAVHDIRYDAIGFRMPRNEFLPAVGHAENMPEDTIKIQHHQAQHGAGDQQ